MTGAFSRAHVRLVLFKAILLYVSLHRRKGSVVEEEEGQLNGC